MTALSRVWSVTRRWGEHVSRAGRKLHGARPAIRIAAIAAIILLGLPTINLVYHVLRKPVEMFAFISSKFNKTPAKTWRDYGSLFREYSTAVISPELLAALAQVEGAGNPLARTYWRWQLSWNPLALYHPASSAVGMFQMTDAAFAEARRFCIRDHVVIEDGCRFNWALYSRRAKPCDPARGGLSGPQCRESSCRPPQRQAKRRAQAGTGGDSSPLRRRFSQLVCAAWVSSASCRALRRARRRRLPRPRQSNAAGVPPDGRKPINYGGSALASAPADTRRMHHADQRC